MERCCRKCGKNIPNRVEIDGKVRNLGGRKFCLECSPFGGRNTKPDDPARKSVYGQKNYKKMPYSQWDEHAKEAFRVAVYRKGWRRKLEAIDYKGGACQECGYNQCEIVLTFHHIDPPTKKFSLSTDNLRRLSWANTVAELDKCELLCLNCHMEKEAALQINKTSQHLRGLERKQQVVTELGGKCLICGYSKCLRSLSFHHREPSLKLFPLDIRSFNGYSWERLREEIAKCDLLCLNCHQELEFSLRASKYRI